MTPEKREYHKQWYLKNRERQLALGRAWKAANREKRKADGAAYRAANAERERERHRKYREQNGEKLKAAQAAYYAANKERCRAATRRWMEQNGERLRAAAKAWAAENRNELDARRRAQRRRAVPAWADLAAMRKIYREAKAKGLHVDRIVPLRSRLVCGLHCEANLQLLTAEENIRKSNKTWPGMP